MINDSVTLNDGTANRTYQLVSRIGMDSIRRETTAGVSSASMSKMEIKNTIDDKATSKPNRHLVKFTFTEYDAAGKPLVSTVHCVITRAKGATDDTVIKLAELCAAFVGDSANVSQMFIGGN